MHKSGRFAIASARKFFRIAESDNFFDFFRTDNHRDLTTLYRRKMELLDAAAHLVTFRVSDDLS